jgi:hypothetical protein
MADDEFTALFLRKDNATKGFVETSIHWPEPSKIPAVIKELTRGMTNAPGAYWLTLPAWSAQQAAWLAFNIDPSQVMTPTWRIPGPRESREATARAGAAVITENLIAAVGERGSPADYVRAIRSLGIHPEWMGDHYRDECAPVATVTEGNALEQREKALVHWLESKTIPRAEWPRLKSIHGMTRKTMYKELKEYPAFKSRHSSEPISEKTFVREFWNEQGIASFD